jgi:hypothetical protein
MLAWQRAQHLWDAHFPDRSFESLLGWYLSSGLVHVTPSVFLLARQVEWKLEDGRWGMGEGAPNAWFVELAASRTDPTIAMSPAREFMRVATHPLPFVVWARVAKTGPRLHAYRWDQMARRVGLPPS